MFSIFKQSSKKQNTPITKEQIATLLHFCFCNARDLYEEAELLRTNEKYARAFYLCCAALEELAKIPLVLNGIFISKEDANAWRGFWRAFNSHEAKQGAGRAYGRITEIVNQDRWSRFYKNRIPEGLPFNDMKLASLYVDCYDGVALRPNKLFGAKGAVESIFRIVKDRIAAFAQLHSTIDGSIQFVETAAHLSVKMNGDDLENVIPKRFRELYSGIRDAKRQS
jgi:AbiV family abortive infection protein